MTAAPAANRHFQVLDRVLSSDDVATLESRCRSLMAKVPPETKRHFNDKVRKQFLTDRRMFQTMLAVLDAPQVRDFIRARASQPYIDHVDLLIKEAHGPVTAWHQDGPYWRWDKPPSMFTLWVALGDVDESNGCLRVAGDVDEFLPHRKNVYDEANGYWQFVIDESLVDVSSYPVQTIPLKSGCAVAFDSFVIHSAFANATDLPRFSFKVVFGDRAHRDARGGDHVMALTGLEHRINRQFNYLPAFVAVNAKKLLKPRLRAVLRRIGL